MRAKPLSKAAATAIGELVLARAAEHKQRSRQPLLPGVDSSTYMHVVAADLAATLLGAVCGVEAELQMRRTLGTGAESHAFGPALRSDAEHAAAQARRTRQPALPRPARRFIDLTHPQD